MVAERRTPKDLRSIVERAEEVARFIEAGNSPTHDDAADAYADRADLLDLCRTLARALRRLAEEHGIDRCPLCGDPECPSPLLDVLTEAQDG